MSREALLSGLELTKTGGARSLLFFPLPLALKTSENALLSFLELV